MKNFIKISLLILFVIFVFGITTSDAYTVGSGTTPSQMLSALNNGDTLTGITDSVRDRNAYLYCRQRYVITWEGANYRLDSTTPTVFPDDDPVNGHAKAYIIAAPGAPRYVKNDGDTNKISKTDERQWAWYVINGQLSDPNDLNNIATAYQNYKNAENELIAKNGIATKLTQGDNANTFSSGGKIVYGPIQVEYLYKKATSGSHSDEWGGFNYTFLDENGNNVSDKVKLCILSDSGEYTPITSTLISSTGYYKVSTVDYNKKDLYIATTDTTITKIDMKIQSNTVNYTAKVYEISGSVYLPYEEMDYCQACREEYVHFNGKLYKYHYTANNLKISSSTPQYNLIRYGAYTVNGSRATNNGMKTYYIGRNGGRHDTQYAAAGTFISSSGIYFSCYCGRMFVDRNEGISHAYTHVGTETVTDWTYSITYYTLYGGCGEPLYGSKGSTVCGHPRDAGNYSAQGLTLIESASENEETEDELLTDIELGASIEVTKIWNDYDNKFALRPEELKFNIFRSINPDEGNWEKLTENTDYKVEIISKEGNTWKILITGLTRTDNNGNAYIFKVEEQELVCFQATYPEGMNPEVSADNAGLWYIDIENTLKDINISGYVWLDGQTGIKPAVPSNGIIDGEEQRLENIVVYLYHRDPVTNEVSKVAETVTNANGYYEFKDHEIGNYYVEFEYDGVHYEDTIQVENGSSKAFENDNSRNTFNARFETITYKESNDGTTLNYNYADKKSTLNTNTEGSTRIASEFIMNSVTVEELYSADVEHLDFGLVKRGTDIALLTDVYDATVSINGQTTDYEFNKEDNSIEIGTTESSEKVTYNLNLYASDYNYRVRDYITNDGFVESDFVNNENPSGVTTGPDLQIYVIYKLNLQNQSTETVRINEVKYAYDEKYTFERDLTEIYNAENGGITHSQEHDVSGENAVIINLDGLILNEGETKTRYLVFRVNETNNAVNQGNYSNKAEVISYSTDEGFIDIDSQPGNFVNDNQVEDDNDTAGGLTIKTEDSFVRKITGNVFDEDGNNVNDVIVQLIELKTVNGKTYEYIWQETVSGTETGLRLNGDGTALEQYTYTKADGYYEFKGFIPGDYIVRFIYGDGTTYDMTGSVIKYNGQDYKSMPDPNYNAEWYNTTSYSNGASVARDNEARRIETMAYSVEINSVKGVLLKLLNNVSADTLNLTEKEILVVSYNFYYDPDIEYTKIEDVSDDDINNAINKLLKDHVLNNTWMCAETSKIKVAVETEDPANIATGTQVNGIAGTYVSEIGNINFGLELRPVTKIELKKYITGFKLIAANGQTLVNAYVDVNEYLTDEYEANPAYIVNKVQGIKDNVTILDTVWQYEVVPTEINTIVDGANLEFEYTLVVKNTGDTDYLSAELADAYANSSTADYKAFLTNRASEIKSAMRNGTYRTQIGNSMGSNYYLGGTGARKVLTEVTKIRDYINNDLTFVTSGDVEVDSSAPHTHRILRDDYSMQEATINTILRSTQPTGKMENDGTVVLYEVTLGKNPISSTGNLNFENYIAEVMSYTNAAGRRAMTSTPGNAEIVDHEHRAGKSHEIDEADTARIQIGAATGEDIKTNYIIIVAIAAGITVVALGAYIIKKHIMK